MFIVTLLKECNILKWSSIYSNHCKTATPMVQDLWHNLLQSTDQQVDYLPNLTDLLYGSNISIVSAEMVVLYLHYAQEGQLLCRFLEDLSILYNIEFSNLKILYCHELLVCFPFLVLTVTDVFLPELTTALNNLPSINVMSLGFNYSDVHMFKLHWWSASFWLSQILCTC